MFGVILARRRRTHTGYIAYSTQRKERKHFFVQYGRYCGRSFCIKKLAILKKFCRISATIQSDKEYFAHLFLTTIPFSSLISTFFCSMQNACLRLQTNAVTRKDDASTERPKSPAAADNVSDTTDGDASSNISGHSDAEAASSSASPVLAESAPNAAIATTSNNWRDIFSLSIDADAPLSSATALNAQIAASNDENSVSQVKSVAKKRPRMEDLSGLASTSSGHRSERMDQAIKIAESDQKVRCLLDELEGWSPNDDFDAVFEALANPSEEFLDLVEKFGPILSL